MKRILILAALLCASATINAKVTLPAVIGDNMVLQQQTSVSLWGNATPGKTVTIKAGWTSQKFSAKADNEGKWLAKIPTPVAGGPYELSFTEGETLTLSNVLIGEVWLCSGQSNMEMPVKGFGAQPVVGGIDFIVNAKTSTPIRICHVKRCSATRTVADVECSWKENDPETVSTTTAAGYFFADAIHKATGLPVGIIESDWGGSSIEAWIPREVLEKEFAGEFNYDHLALPEEIYTGNRPHQLPSLLFNGQISALIPFTVKGILWYQGETNRGNPEQYTRLQTSYVKTMRDLFQVPDAAFYFVQIAPYPYNNKDSWTSGYFYEAQAATLKTIPHSGMAATVDVGEYGTIHPSKKQEVGKRLAYLALKNDYGMSFLEAEPPIYKDVKFENGKAVVTFDNTPSGLAPLGTELPGFEIAGADQVFYPAKAMVSNGNKAVTVSSDKVAEPAAVRYCFRNFQEGGLYNTFNIPASPFRTDNWDLQ